MRKLRTRQHQIEDLSYNFVEKQVLEAFGVLQTYPRRQYSYDATIHTFMENGAYENGLIYVQVKATDKLVFSTKNNGYELRLDKRDLDLWIYEGYPVLVVLYDAKNSQGFFIELHQYFKKNKLVLKEIGNTKTIFIPADSIFDLSAIKIIQQLKNDFHESVNSVQGYEPYLR